MSHFAESSNPTLSRTGHGAKPIEGLMARDGRLDGLKELVAHLAHDFNNSLVPLLGYITLLQEEVRPGMAGHHYVNKLDSCARKTDDLIRALLRATHPGRDYSPREADLSTIVKSQTAEWLKAVPGNPQIAVEVECEPCSLWLDEKQWRLALTHLLNNAQAALPKGGTIKVRLKPSELEAGVKSDLGIAAARVQELIVEDPGCGMTEETLRRAFEPFFTTRPAVPTTGLGLTFVHSVVQLHGGRIFLESAEDRGTTIRILLPETAP